MVRNELFPKEQDVFIKAEKLKNLFKALDPEITLVRMLYYLNKLTEYQYRKDGRVRILTDFDLKVKNMLEGYKIVPKTGYRWLKKTIIPSEFRQMFYDNSRIKGIDSSKAQKLIQNEYNKKKASLHLMIIEEGRKIFGGL